jgi:Tfp pilus assembly protein PilN
MIEVNLHPSGEKKRRKKGGLFSGVDLGMPDFGDIEILDSIRAEPWNAAFIASLVIVPLIVGVLWFTQRSSEQELESRLDTALADSARLADLRALSDSLTERRTEIRSRIELVRGLDQNRYVWPHLMDEVASALPSSAWLQGVTQQSPLPGLQVQVEGTAGTPLVITDFVRNLESSPYIRDVQIVGSSKEIIDGVSTQSFTLNLRYRAQTDTTPATITLSTGGG